MNPHKIHVDQGWSPGETRIWCECTDGILFEKEGLPALLAFLESHSRLPLTPGSLAGTVAQDQEIPGKEKNLKTVQVQKSTRKAEDEDITELPEVTPSEVSQETKDLLDEIDCCLADNEADPDAELKAKAKAEWYALPRERGYGSVNTRTVQYNVWMAQYQHLFEWCCGQPDFGD